MAVKRAGAREARRGISPSIDFVVAAQASIDFVVAAQAGVTSLRA